MAPRKDKVSSQEASDLILEYLRKQNHRQPRFLQTSTTKSPNVAVFASPADGAVAAAKHLKELSERREIEERGSGKSLVYHPLQPEDSSSDNEIISIGLSITTMKEDTSALQAEVKALKTRLSTNKNAVTTLQLRSQLDALAEEKSLLATRLEELGNTQEDMGRAPLQDLTGPLQDWARLEQRRARIKDEMRAIVRDACASSGVDASGVLES